MNNSTINLSNSKIFNNSAKYDAAIAYFKDDEDLPDNNITSIFTISDSLIEGNSAKEN
jgi:hypothetical protein